MSEGSFEAIRFRHSGLEPEEVVTVTASFRLMEFVPKVGELVNRFRERTLEEKESKDFAAHALALRYGGLDRAPIEPETLLKAHRPEDEGEDLWRTLNRVQESLVRGGLSDSRRDRRGRLRSVRTLRGIDSKVGLNKGLWGLAEHLVSGLPLESAERVVLN